MTALRRLVVVAILLLVVGAIAWRIARTPIIAAVARRVAERRLAVDAIASLRSTHGDALHVVLCGTGAPLVDPGRAGPCTLVATPDRVIVVDAGGDVAGQMAWLGIRIGQIDHLLITHYHSDHIDGLGELMLQRWAEAARTTPLPVHGPPGVDRVVGGFNEAYALDTKYRIAHHGPAIFPPSGAGGTAEPFPAPGPGEPVVVLDEADLRVTAFAVDHDPVRPAVGYRFDWRGRSVLVSGDTRKSANLEKFAHGVDLLVHEGQAAHLLAIMRQAALAAGRQTIAQISRDILRYHTTPVEAAEIARDAGVRMLVLTHLIPPLPVAPMEWAFTDGVADVWNGETVVGRDGMTFSLPTGSTAIVRGKL